MLRDLQEVVPVLPINPAVWLAAMRLARKRRDTGLTVPVTDVVIAAGAFHHGVELEHCDGRFEAIKTAWKNAGQ